MQIVSAMLRSVTRDWQRLAQAVRDRRNALGLTQSEAVARSGGGVSLPVWQNLENARQDAYKQRTLQAVARALGWTPTSIEVVLAGGPPELDGEAPPGHVDLTLTEQVARLDERLDRVESILSAVAAQLGVRQP